MGFRIVAIQAAKCPLGHTEIAFSEHTYYKTIFPEIINTHANQPIAVFIGHNSKEVRNVLEIAINAKAFVQQHFICREFTPSP